MNYYNDFDKFASKWLIELMKDNMIPTKQSKEPERIQPEMDRQAEQWEQSCDNSPVVLEGKLEIEPALFPLADGIPGRVGLLKGAGNAIVPQVAAEFIKATMDILAT